MGQWAGTSPYAIAIPRTWGSGQDIAQLTASTSGRQAPNPFVGRAGARGA